MARLSSGSWLAGLLKAAYSAVEMPPTQTEGL